MKTIAIIGSGPGLGLSLARRFGREGHRVKNKPGDNLNHHRYDGE